MGIFTRFRAAMGGYPPPGTAGALVGEYDMRSGRLVGSVYHDQLAFKEKVEIRVVRYADLKVHVLAECEASRDPLHRCYRFSMVVKDLFPPAELLTDSVKVTAIAENGDSGDLQLNGVTQIELIRDHLGVPSKTVVDLDFTRGGNASDYLGPGWSGAELDFTWTLEDESWLAFSSPTEEGDYRLRIKSAAHIRNPDLDKQVMSVFVNDYRVGVVINNVGFAQYDEFKVPYEVLAIAPRTTLRLHHPNAGRPCDFSDNQDSRRLAFAVQRLWIVRLSPQINAICEV